ncbi:hypothetical protein GWR56_15225 [Mucilaginibacter sp. 14171R-50]|uniref:hypothetical protein n=1 Tax=Mucilaginibacter sp. 14171R-50 TaxID=2703789 RepID=UPI00138C2B22|nr:hypothetical protein [Mucilaginibacter sp. 14171R-50]QHS56831.1 hypothetical protein GWR56_15225 [Mucilaginibacter sp. 14171R-50]
MRRFNIDIELPRYLARIQMDDVSSVSRSMLKTLQFDIDILTLIIPVEGRCYGYHKPEPGFYFSYVEVGRPRKGCGCKYHSAFPIKISAFDNNIDNHSVYILPAYPGLSAAQIRASMLN